MWLWPRAGNGESFGADPTIKLDLRATRLVFLKLIVDFWFGSLWLKYFWPYKETCLLIFYFNGCEWSFKTAGFTVFWVFFVLLDQKNFWNLNIVVLLPLAKCFTDVYFSKYMYLFPLCFIWTGFASPQRLFDHWKCDTDFCMLTRRCILTVNMKNVSYTVLQQMLY